MSRLSIAAIQSLGSSLTDMREREETILNSRHVNMMMGYLLCDSRLMQNSINLQQAGVKRPLMVLRCLHWLDQLPGTKCIHIRQPSY
jgi:hypothetical protein